MHIFPGAFSPAKPKKKRPTGSGVGELHTLHSSVRESQLQPCTQYQGIDVPRLWVSC